MPPLHAVLCRAMPRRAVPCAPCAVPRPPASQNLIEYIEACPARPDLDARLATDGEAQGVRRVRTALHAHQWPNLKQVPPQMQQAAAPGPRGAASGPTSQAPAAATAGAGRSVGCGV